jgi:lipopolysaccharide/colanic/teichoic acid biosynthesis glycosyltransferase/glycosyltransferase involved in cell wall biosynthesis
MGEPVAIVHDWLTSMRGGERVVEALYGVFPDADLFTLTWDPARLSPALSTRRATTSAIHRVANAPFVSGRFRALLPLFPRAVESFDLAGYSLVVSSSHCVAIGARAPAGALHVAYVHSTMRYTREGQPAYEASVPGGRVGRAAFRSAAHYLRRWEVEAAARPHVLIANSSYTRERIRQYYQRDAEVIEPPIETSRFAAAAAYPHDPSAPFLVVSALVPNKRVDLALRAFQGRRERLVVVGDGPERARLERLAGPNVTLLPRLEEAELVALFARSRALLHPGVDDFGMVMVEALAAGKPVLAVAEGGALDIVHDGVTGVRIDAPTVDAVRAAIDRFSRMPVPFDPATLREYAHRFDRSHFERRFAAAVDAARGRHRPPRPRRGRVSVGARTAMTGGRAAHSTGGSNGVPRPVERSPGPAGPADPPGGELTLVGNGALSGVKRVFDVAFAATGLCAAAPLMVACGAAIALADRQEPLFFQERVGLGGKPFTMVKLRTMNDAGQATRLGSWLRPLGLDELPQLWNVLKGDMSVIGPRPEVPSRVARYRTELRGYDERHSVRPGITGLAQVQGLRGDHSGTIAERLSYDVRYVREWSLAVDLAIAARTVPRVLGDTLRARVRQRGG